MDTFMKFLFDFLAQFFGGVLLIVKGVIQGFGQMFNIGEIC